MENHLDKVLCFFCLASDDILVRNHPIKQSALLCVDVIS